MSDSKNSFFEKFPHLVLNGKRLVWDTRQNPTSQDLIYITAEQDEKTVHSLKQVGGQVINSQTPPFALGQDASQACGHPSKKLKIIGVTGTNGKTSTATFCSHLLSEAGLKVLQIGTLGSKIWKKGTSSPYESIGYTTPLAPQLHHLIEKARRAHIEAIVMEVSSHALSLGRVAGCLFDERIFTNLTQDHLDFHKTMDAYFEAKKSFFNSEYRKETCGDWISLSSIWGQKLCQEITESFGFDPIRQIKILTENLNYLGFEYLPKGLRFQLPVIGKFQIENALAAALACSHLLARDPQEIANFTQNFPGIKGRMERISHPTKYLFVDYAHTPDALKQTLQSLLQLKSSGQKLFVVFGCGGDRDKTKRPQMGKIASELADEVFITSDNPRTENPDQIINDILNGISQDKQTRVRTQADRAQAIESAFGEMSKNDILVVAGKGHEEYQIIGKESIHFSDQENLFRLSSS